jgi:bifunctional non-homologous end joining protein LigD
VQNESVQLFLKDGSSDKFYSVSLILSTEKQDRGMIKSWSVPFTCGRRGDTGQSGYKVHKVEYEVAKNAYDKVVKEKMTKGYTLDPTGKPFAPTPTSLINSDSMMFISIPTSKIIKYPVQLLEEIDESQSRRLISDSDWWAQQKFDGKRMVLEWDGKTLMAYNRTGVQCGCPSLYYDALKGRTITCVLDGESVGCEYHVFDILQCDGKCVKDMGYAERYDMLRSIISRHACAIHLVHTAKTKAAKDELFQDLQSCGREGIVFKHVDEPYEPGLHGTQVKYKFTASATCIVTKVNHQASVALGVRTAGNDLMLIGNVTIPVNHKKPAVGDYVEIRYLYCRRGGSLIQPVYLGVRDDKDRADELNTLKFKDESQEE